MAEDKIRDEVRKRIREMQVDDMKKEKDDYRTGEGIKKQGGDKLKNRLE